MKKSITLILVVISLFIIPVAVNGQVNKQTFDEKNAVLINETVKYIKTVDEYKNVVRDSYGNISSADKVRSETYELTKKEWDNSDFKNNTITRGVTVIEANYRIMTTSLYYSNGTYRYKNQISWTTFPSVRAFDVIGIGHYGTVAVNGNPSFSLNYVTLSGIHLSSFIYYNQNFTYGSSASFPLPLENLQSLSIMYYYDVKKVNPSNTITAQGAFGDYSHGINSSLTLSQASNHEVYQSFGIVFDSSVFSKFDEVDEAAVYWSGSW